jgi:phosphoglycerate dehydrogenase-like enzyme
MKSKVLFAVSKEKYSKIFSQKDLHRISNFCEVIKAEIPQLPDKDFLLKYISDADIVITSWNTANIDTEIMSKAKKLKLLTHAAGTVKPVISDALWDGGVKVTSAASAIAYGVAEFCLGLILMTPKRVFWAAQGTKQGRWQEDTKVFNGPFEIYQQKIGIIGASYVGKFLIKLLKNFSCDILLYDPYCSEQKAGELGVKKINSLEELFGQCRVISLNAPSTQETKGIVRGEHFRLLPDGAVFINTARGAIINEPEMIEELKKQRFVACLDVTEPEPPAVDSPLRNLPNVILTPHEAGVIAENMLRLGTFVADEIESFINGQKLHFEVTHQQLKMIG